MFNYLLYKKIHGVAMGAPLAPSLLNAFLSHHEKSGQTIIPKDLSKFFNDVISMVFLHFSNYHLKCFQDFMNSRHINMSFFLESEKENKLFFLDLEFICKQGKFTATFYRKSTFSGTYSNFERFSLLAWSILFILFIIFSLYMFLNLHKMDTNTCRFAFTERNILQKWLLWKFYWKMF